MKPSTNNDFNWRGPSTTGFRIKEVKPMKVGLKTLTTEEQIKKHRDYKAEWARKNRKKRSEGVKKGDVYKDKVLTE
jgi:hypothetical protein